jgi:hypothetical protein
MLSRLHAIDIRAWLANFTPDASALAIRGERGLVGRSSNIALAGSPYDASARAGPALSRTPSATPALYVVADHATASPTVRVGFVSQNLCAIAKECRHKTYVVTSSAERQARSRESRPDHASIRERFRLADLPRSFTAGSRDRGHPSLRNRAKRFNRCDRDIRVD